LPGKSWLEIDSTVMEMEHQRRPGLSDRIRIIESLGPSPMPPWVVSTSVAPDLRDALRQALWGMHTDPHGQAVLTEGQIARLARVEDRDYDAIREMARQAAQVVW